MTGEGTGTEKCAWIRAVETAAGVGSRAVGDKLDTAAVAEGHTLPGAASGVRDEFTTDTGTEDGGSLNDVIPLTEDGGSSIDAAPLTEDGGSSNDAALLAEDEDSSKDAAPLAGPWFGSSGTRRQRCGGT